jgi:hypothetical protein
MASAPHAGKGGTSRAKGCKTAAKTAKMNKTSFFMRSPNILYHISGARHCFQEKVAKTVELFLDLSFYLMI